MVAVAAYCVLFAAPEQLTQIRGDALATLAYGANWRAVFARQNYWALFTAPSPLNHTWSLAIEEQFYVIWPLVFAGLLVWWKRATAKAVLVLSLGLACVSSVLMITLYDPANSARAYFGTDTRAAAVLFGAALAAWLAVRGPARNRTALEVVGLLGAVVLAVAWSRLDGQSSTLYRGGFLVCGLAATAVIAAVAHPEPGLLSRVLSLRPLCMLGLISYGVYLYHWPIDVVLDEKRVGFGGWPLFAVQTMVTLAAAIASYRLIEQPIRHGALSGRQWRTLTPAVAVGLVAVLVVSTSGGHPRVVNAAGGDLMVDPAERAFRNAPSGAERVLIVGNSVAFFLGQSMQHIHTDPPIVAFDAGFPACIFPPEITGERVATAEGATVIQPTIPCDFASQARVVNGFRPNVVFWIVSNIESGGLRYRGQWVRPCTEPYESLYQRSLRTEAAVLGARGAKVVITTAAYPRYFLSPPNGPTDCDNRLRRKVAAETGAQLVDLFSYICPRGQCRAKQNGVTLRPDGLHYEGPGGEIVARWLIDQIH